MTDLTFETIDPEGFAGWLAAATGPILVVGHNDADGLSAIAIFARTLEKAGHTVRLRIMGRGENPWSPAFRHELESDPPGGLIVTDLGIRDGAILPGTPTLLVDHHIPAGTPGRATVITGFGSDPIPTSSLLAYRCARSLGEVEDLLWLAAIGIIGDMAEKDGFPEMAEARARHKVTALREATALVNAPRRSAGGDAGPALALLLQANGPDEILSGEHAETAILVAAREENKRALETARKVPPRIAGRVALIAFHSPCQIHPLVAQSWRGRLKDKIVIAANTGYRPGWVHFAARTATGENLIDFLRDVAPPGADENYGSGHAQATGGALRSDNWSAFLRNVGFAPDPALAAEGRAA